MKDFFEFKCEEVREIVEDCENNGYGIVYVQTVPEHQGSIIMDLEMMGYSIEEPYVDEDEEENDEGYNPENYILTMVRVNKGLGMIRHSEITPELAKEVKSYQEWLRKKAKVSPSQKTGVKNGS